MRWLMRLIDIRRYSTRQTSCEKRSMATEMLGRLMSTSLLNHKRVIRTIRRVCMQRTRRARYLPIPVHGLKAGGHQYISLNHAHAAQNVHKSSVVSYCRICSPLLLRRTQVDATLKQQKALLKISENSSHLMQPSVRRYILTKPKDHAMQMQPARKRIMQAHLSPES